MASVQPKKVAAILAAVLQHASEAETPQPTVALAAAAAPCALPAPPVWALSGRQEAMSDRVLWQRRHSRSW